MGDDLDSPAEERVGRERFLVMEEGRLEGFEESRGSKQSLCRKINEDGVKMEQPRSEAQRMKLRHDWTSFSGDSLG